MKTTTAVQFEMQSTQQGDPYPVIMLYSETGENDHAHMIPVQAIANRMEIFGLADEIEALEWIGRESRQPAEADRSTEIVIPAYKEAIQQDTSYIIKNPAVARVLSRGTARTVMDCGASSTAVCDKLDNSRHQARKMLALAEVKTPVQQPFRDTTVIRRDKAATALMCNSACISEILEYIDTECAGAVYAYQLATAAEYDARVAQIMNNT